MTGGLVWQFALAMMLVGREPRTLRPAVLRDALWLRAPRSPQEGVRGGRDLGKFLGSHAGHVLLAGSWGWFALLVALFLFNTALGEELLFRG